MDAATLTIDLDKRRCCYCSASKSRCLTDSCFCYKQGRQCESECESSNWTGDCLNQSIMRCDCTRIYNPVGSLKKPEFIFCNENSDCPCFRFNEGCSLACGCRGECTNIVGHHNNAVLDYEHFPKLDRPQCGCACTGRGGCRKFKKCLCLQSLSFCSPSCKCKQECVNTKTHFELSKHARNSMFDPEESPSGSTAILHLIGGNNYGFQLEFATPNLAVIHAEEILCRVLTRALSVYALPIQHVIVYTPNSPCFHQDCHPKCEIVDNCVYGKSCASALSILYKQIRKLTRNTHIEMTVRFLHPYMARGDLYTKRAILALTEHGIRVEPITIKEWADLMRDSLHRLKKRSMSTDRFFQRHHHHHKEPYESNFTPNATAYHNLWNVADMDRFVRLAQYYINECRRTLGYSECYWTSSFHDLLKMTVLACAGASEKLRHISIHLNPPMVSASSFRDSMDGSTARSKRQQQLKRQNRLSYNEENVIGNAVASTSAPSSMKKPNAAPSAISTATSTTHRIRCNSGPSSFRNSRFRIVNESFAESLSRSVNEIELDDEFPLSTPTTTTADFNDSQFNDTLSRDHHRASSVPPARSSDLETKIQKLTNHAFSTSIASSSISLHAPAAAMADKILLNLAGRNMMEIEQQEIKAEVVNSIEAIQQQLYALMQYLDQKIASVPVWFNVRVASETAIISNYCQVLIRIASNWHSMNGFYCTVMEQKSFDGKSWRW